MASYVVMTAPGRSGPDGPLAEFVRDGFAVFAFLVPWLWLLWHRMWIEAALALAATLVLAALGTVAGYAVAGSLLSLLVSIYVGLEGRGLRVAALRRRGWSEWGVVEADSVDEAEIRFITEIEPELERRDQTPTVMPSAPSPRAAIADHGPGLLLNPGNR